MRRTLLRNIAVADYEGMPISKLEVVPSSHQEPWKLQYRPKTLPPLLITCQESREEAKIDAARNLRNGVKSTKLMQYYWDIAYLKDFKFYRPWRIDNPDMRKFTPDCFRYIEALIISRRLCRLRCYDLVDTDFFPYAFPKLRVLLDDKDQLHSLSNALDGENSFRRRQLAKYKWGQQLVKLFMGPFGKAHGVNKNSIEEDIREALGLTQAENLKGSYTAPSIIGRSYSLPESIESLLSANPWPDLDSEYEAWIPSESSYSSGSEK
ncbi:hypothetical protein IFR05_004442 [Cadophora sp. M221]|nr:hypothetical protein IFR05_004442 [Cadophora sp. M221]